MLKHGEVYIAYEVDDSRSQARAVALFTDQNSAKKWTKKANAGAVTYFSYMKDSHFSWAHISDLVGSDKDAFDALENFGFGE